MATFWTENGQAQAESDDPPGLHAEVRRALRHLYDPVYLQRCSLAAMLQGRDDEAEFEGREAQALRRMLVQAIDQLSPGGNVPLRSSERRGYAVLRGRYVDQTSMEELAQSLNLSERQLRRELHGAVEAVVAILAPHLTPAGQAATPAGAQDGLLSEIETFGLAREAVNLCAEARSVGALVASLAQDRGVVLVDELGLENVVVRANRVVLRQGLLALCSWAIQNHCSSVLTSRMVTQEREVAFALACLDPPEAGGPPELPLEDVVRPALLAALQGRLEYTEMQGGRALRLWLPAMPTHSVLLIDDNPSLHLLFGRYLSGFPYSLHSAYDAPSGLTLAHSERPDVIVLDIMMPDQDGWELLAALREDPLCRDIPVVVCSVLAQEALAESLSASGYLGKPVTQGALLASLRSLGLRDLA